MKKIRYNKIFGWLAAAVLLLTTSCKDDMLFGNGQSEEVTVTFTLTPEAVAPLATRAHKGNNVDDAHVMYPDPGEYHHISDGSRADMLIYSLYEKVYDDKGNYKYELLEGYSDGSDIPGITAGDGQTIMSIDEFPVTIRLTLKRGTEYSIAFWAQNSECKAYNTNDLRKVEVIYGELEDSTSEDDSSNGGSNGGNGNTSDASDTQTTTPNNDERRDAFCRSLTFIAGEGGLEQNVLLYRPLAQINVGTSGYDFETITRNADKKYLYSKIRLNRVARYLDVVEDKTYSSTTDEEDSFSQDDAKKTAEAFAVVDFGYAPIPAYINWPEKENENGRLYPEYPSYTIWDWEYDNDYDNKFPHREAYGKENYEGEEFLRVHLSDDGFTGHDDIDRDLDGNIYTSKDADGYRKYANLNNHNDERSETFKYLSMCYVLTSSTKEEAITINNVKVWLATKADGSDEIEIVNLNNVPAQRNWRTNIVGNILTEENKFTVKLDRDFAGEYNGLYEGNEISEWSGPLAKGVYYDAENDEIQISDVDGLLWLQKMVNGTMTVRVNNETSKSKAGDKYKYFDIDGNEGTLTYVGIPDPTLGEGNDTKANQALKERILRATHQDQNAAGKDGWPANNNFHFMGVKNGVVSKATVRLMNDINLSGIEWLPIGFDAAVYDGSTREFVNINTDFWYTNKTNNKGASAVRAFCGNFNGGYHTVSNLENKRFGAKIHSTGVQDTGDGPYDNPQWFPAGFFGMLGGNATIENLRLFNVDLYGYHTGGGIAGIACGDEIDIKNCVVDGGKVRLYPMFRGDGYQQLQNNPTYYPDGVEKDNARTFARGIYVGGIVGYYNANGNITNNDVKNLTLKAYRNIGGVVGSMATAYSNTSPPANVTFKEAKSVSGNNVSNVLIIADKFQPYDFCFNTTSTEGVYKTGFGWNSNQLANAGDYVGGNTTKYDNGNNKSSLRISEFSTKITDVKTSTERIADIGDVPLKELPLLSSWFCDNVTLSANFYGEPSAQRLYADHLFRTPKVTKDSYDKSMVTSDFYYPFKLPFNLTVDFIENSGNVGLYVESVNLTGNAIGGRSVITPTNVSGDNSCVMYVTARDRKAMCSAISKSNISYRQSTNIKNVVLRGEPYAWAGMLIAPNENMSAVELENVAIYDVYQTIALDKNVPKTGNDYDVTFNVDRGTNWTDADDITLTANKCNFRGYTVPGAGWKEIKYTNTTFEEGTYTGHGRDERTYKVEANTTFEGCYFKAPYRIDLSGLNGKTVTFTDSKASSASPNNKTISITGEKAAAKLITITSDSNGNPVVRYYAGIDKDGKGTDLIVKE